MFSSKQICKIEEIFEYAQTINRAKEHKIYIDSIDTFLAISSFVLGDKQLYPHWVSEININSILEVCFLVPANGGSRLYINEMVYYYQQWKDKVWEFIDKFDLLPKMTLLEKYFDVRDFLKNMFSDSLYLLHGEEPTDMIVVKSYLESIIDCASFRSLISPKIRSANSR